MASATLTSKGRVTLPKTVRDRLGAEAGDRIEFVELVKPKKPVTIEDMNRERRSPHEHSNFG
jgi:AbrB family looped-hinge helix DNA binding protein